MKKISNKKIITCLLSVIFISFFFSKIVFAVWDGLPYNPGETNNPECLPSQTDCDVLPAVTTELDPVFTTWLTTTPPLYSYTETDPAFSAWNKSTGISITKSQISDFPAIPNTLASLADDSTHRLVTDTEKSIWNGKQDALGFIPVSNATTVNGHALSGDISVTATDVGLGNVPNISFSGSNTGDETTSSIQTKLGTVSTSTSGYLTSTDWNIFNNKQPSGSYLTSFTELDPAFTTWLTTTPPLYSYTETDPIFTTWNKSTGISITESQISDLQHYLTSYTETDPIFVASQANNITSGDITNLSHLSGINSGDNAVNSLYSGLVTSKQDALNGTGLVKMSGTSVSYDNSTYLTAVPAGYLQNNVGIAGGTTLIGGTLASQNLTLSSTSNATKGNILFGTSAYDEVNNRLGIRTTSPGSGLDVSGSTSSTGIRTTLSTNSAYYANLWVNTSGNTNLTTTGGSNNLYITPAANTIISSGNVSIGTATTPENKLSIVGADDTIPALGTNGGKLGIFNGAGNGSHGLVGGVLGSGNVFLQAQTITSTGIAYNMLLQPNGGNVGIGTTSPTSILQTIASGAKTTAYTGNLLTNTATSGTASIAKIGLDVQSTGTWNGTTATNTGLNVNVSGGTTNYAATFMGGNVGIGTTAPTTNLDIKKNSGATGYVSLNVQDLNASGEGSFSVKNDNYYGAFEVFGSNFGVAGLRNHALFTTQSGITELGFATLGAAPITFLTNSTGVTNERMRIDSTGNVGIGTTSPTAKLHIRAGTAGASTAPLKFTSGTNLTTAEAGAVEYDGTQLYFSPSTTRNILAQVSGSTTLTTGSIPFATTSGYLTQDNANLFYDATNHRLGISNTAPGFLLHVGSASATTGTTVARFENAGGTCDIVPSTSGGVTCSSDMNLKKNINTLDDITWTQTQLSTQPITNLDKILALVPVTYNWKTEQDTDAKHTGFIAQDVQQLFPDLVSTDPTTNLLSLNYSGMIPYTVKAIKEMNLKLLDINNFDKPNDWRDSLIAWFGNAENHITRIFTGEVCLTEAGEETVCINRTELKSLKALLNGTSANTNTTTNSETNTNTTPSTSTTVTDSTTTEGGDSPVPTCTDGIKNQNETDIDTGGVCVSKESEVLPKVIPLPTEPEVIIPTETTPIPETTTQESIIVPETTQP